MPYKRNNPGNIRPGVPFKGSTPDGPFLKFDSLANGFRAIFLDIQAKKKRGVKTLKDYFRIYAPASDGNNPDAYAQYVANRIGQGNLPTTAPDSIAMALAMAQLEHGKAPNQTDMEAAKTGYYQSGTQAPAEVKEKSIWLSLVPIGLAIYLFPKFFR